MMHRDIRAAALLLSLALSLRAQQSSPRAVPGEPPATTTTDAQAPKAPVTPKKGKAKGNGGKKAPMVTPSTLDPVVAAEVNIKKQLKARSKKGKAVPGSQRIDINSASKEQLKKLKGVTDALAEKIIAGRPYPTKTRLITHDILPMGVFIEIKDHIKAVQKGAK